MDIAGYMTTIMILKLDDTRRLIIAIQPATTCRKDRTGLLGRYIEPDLQRSSMAVRVTLSTRDMAAPEVESKSKQPLSTFQAHAVEMTDARLGKSEADKK